MRSMSDGVQPPICVVLGGPNGSGKTTIAPSLLRDSFGIKHYVNTDVIAQGLSGFSPDEVAFAAGEVMIERIGLLVEQRESFAIETTLSGRSLAVSIREWKGLGYWVHLVYVWLRSPDLNVLRVRERVRRGGHDVPEQTIRRRYRRSLENFFRLYRPLLDGWVFYENADWDGLQEIARSENRVETVVNPAIWNELLSNHG
jgi:predicted ABC-type ATPase